MPMRAVLVALAVTARGPLTPTSSRSATASPSSTSRPTPAASRSRSSRSRAGACSRSAPSWCKPCAKELPAWDKIAPDYKGKVTFVAVDLDDDTPMTARRSTRSSSSRTCSAPTSIRTRRSRREVRLRSHADDGARRSRGRDPLRPRWLREGRRRRRGQEDEGTAREAREVAVSRGASAPRATAAAAEHARRERHRRRDIADHDIDPGGRARHHVERRLRGAAVGAAHRAALQGVPARCVPSRARSITRGAVTSAGSGRGCRRTSGRPRASGRCRAASSARLRASS